MVTGGGVDAPVGSHHRPPTCAASLKRAMGGGPWRSGRDVIGDQPARPVPRWNDYWSTPLAGWGRRHLAATRSLGDMLTVRLTAWICTRVGIPASETCLHSE